MKAAILALGCLGLVACSSYGVKFNFDAADQLRPGITTEAEAIQILRSRPYKRFYAEDGSYTATWWHARLTILGTGRRQELSVLFDVDRVMIRVVAMDRSSI